MYQGYINVLKVKSTITRYVKCFVPGISTSKNLFKKLRLWTTMLLIEALALNKWDEWYEIYLQNKKFKSNAQFVQKVTFKPLMNFKQNHYGSWKYYKSCYFQNFSSAKLLKYTVVILWQCVFNIFMRQPWPDYFGGVTQKYELRVSFKSSLYNYLIKNKIK